LKNRPARSDTLTAQEAIMTVLLQSDVPGYPVRRGKVRDVYDLGDRLAIVATDRISAFDWVMPTGIPGKGELLTAMSRFWFAKLGVPNHLVPDEATALPEPFRPLVARTMVAKKAQVIPFEFVVRGYLAGSVWKEYRRSGTACGVSLPPGLQESSKLTEPLLTPATKAEVGHDENVTFEYLVNAVGAEVASDLRRRTLEVYTRAAALAESHGIILADTKLEWGRLPDGEIILIDEVLTPDNSRFWPADAYKPGSSPPCLDKQYFRDWVETTQWDKNSPPPPIPPEVVATIIAKYREAFDRLTRPATA
jgi:phosphoribosylaminoimidazole-succinocarboxamide synthase